MMPRVVGVRFKPAGKTYDFDAGAFLLALGDRVVVETEQGLGYGIVARPPRAQDEEDEAKALKKVFRKASEDDFEQERRNGLLEAEAAEFCRQTITKLALPMSLFSVESTFDATRLTFFFTAEGRVDFRELVKQLVRRFRVRVELRQIGVRHQARMCGGLGRCGREACCATFLSNFAPVSVKMAKVQNLSLNPTKISGMCGRLMCCLTYEYETYKEIAASFPKIGKSVETPEGKGKVSRHNVMGNKVAVRLAATGQESEFAVVDVKPDAAPPPPPPQPEASRKSEKKKKHKQGQGGPQAGQDANGVPGGNGGQQARPDRPVNGIQDGRPQGGRPQHDRRRGGAPAGQPAREAEAGESDGSGPFPAGDEENE